jgi:small neutral amino acid transporter SnatA (MarC family)
VGLFYPEERLQEGVEPKVLRVAVGPLAMDLSVAPHRVSSLVLSTHQHLRLPALAHIAFATTHYYANDINP